MEDKNKNYTGIVLCTVLALGLGAFWIYSSKPKRVDNTLPPIVEQKPVDNPVVATTTQSGKIDEHLTINNELRDVNFCGKTYKVKQVMVDGVDVVQRVAEIATKNLIPENLKIGPYGPPSKEYWKTVSNKNGEVAKGICENIKNNSIGEVIEVGVFPSTDVGQKGQTTYLVSAHGFHIIVNSLTSEIFDFEDYDGSSIGPLGKLR